jgi:hypothetical protein
MFESLLISKEAAQAVTAARNAMVANAQSKKHTRSTANNNASISSRSKT